MKSIETIVDEVTAELFGNGEMAQLMKPYVERAEKEHPDWNKWSETDKRMYLRDDIEEVIRELVWKQKEPSEMN